MGCLPPMVLTIPSQPRLIRLAHDFVESVCQAGGLDEKTTHAVVLATGEAVSNIVRHAHRNRPDALFQIQCRFQQDGIEICLCDEGEPFDIDAVPHLDPGELREGGRGVFLMRTLMDELSCSPRREGGNTLRMRKRCRCRFFEKS
ncbi:MAG: hypothetical protein KatS3mg105_1811 [Gemmatales bacterium]|nr:MAG: hypothetical protein KatS3mg105_1811 [Gemmatales bacterium]